jgi:hypothetical protein
MVILNSTSTDTYGSDDIATSILDYNTAWESNQTIVGMFNVVQ